MRRLLLALLLIAVATGTAAVAFASGDGSSSKSEPRAAKAERSGGGHGVAHRRGHGHGGMHRAIETMVLRSLAGRLDVKPRALRRAVREIAVAQKAEVFEAAGLTAEEIAALKACHRGHHRARGDRPSRSARRSARRGCRRDETVRSAIRKLRAYEPDLAALKTSLSESLATKLGSGVTAAKVLEAVRAEGALRLDQAVKLGFVSAKGRDLALACFDAPADCDLDALRAEAHRKHARRAHP